MSRHSENEFGERRGGVVSTRVTVDERALIEAAAVVEGASLSDLIRPVILEHARERLQARVAPSEADDE